MEQPRDAPADVKLQTKNPVTPTKPQNPKHQNLCKGLGLRV